MIEIVVYKTGLTTGLSVRGHANAGRHGQDIVCAGVSVLAQSIILSLGIHLKKKLDYKVGESGYLKVELQEDADDLTEAVFSVAILGFEEMAKQYPRNIKLKYQEVKINV